jgi:NADPH:quinone reductase-like Zn-dependent oxidoreductase
MPANQALWLPSRRDNFTVGPAPYNPPGPDEILVRNRAVAINPLDRLIPVIGDIVFPWLRYPVVLGTDLAGEVVDIGENVTRFQLGDRVIGHAVGVEKTRNNPAEGAFQTYTVLAAHMASTIPDSMAYEEAVVLPLGLSTAACGLFQRDFLALNPPSLEPRRSGKTLLVWGGSTSVGSNAIQLAVAAGYEVVTTCSSHNFDYVLGLGARKAFDYHRPSVAQDIIAELDGHEVAGAFAIGVGSTSACIDIMGHCSGRRFVAIASPPVSFDSLPSGSGRLRKMLPLMARMISANVGQVMNARRNRVTTKMIWGGSLLENEVGPMIYERFLPQALALGRYKAAPDPLVVGTGLDHIHTAIELLKQGVSARKLVVQL